MEIDVKSLEDSINGAKDALEALAAYEKTKYDMGTTNHAAFVEYEEIFYETKQVVGTLKELLDRDLLTIASTVDAFETLDTDFATSISKV